MPIDVETLGAVPATTLASPILTGASSIPLTSGTGFPDGGNGDFYIVIDRGLSTQEVVKCASRSGTTITVAASGRGADGSTDQGHDSGASVEHVAAAETIQALIDHADATTGTPHGSAYLTSSDNAATASALETARTISLAGDVTGSTSFDGSGNVSITATVADDSHDHATSITGSAATLTTARSIALGGDLSGSQTFDGSGDITITGDVDITPGSSTGMVLTQGATPTTSTNSTRIVDLGPCVLLFGRVEFTSSGTASSDIVLDLTGLSVDFTQSLSFVMGTYNYEDSSTGENYAGVMGGVSVANDTIEPLRYSSLAPTSQNLGKFLTIGSGDVLSWSAVVYTGT